MKYFSFFFCLFWLWSISAQALSVTQQMQTSIGLFDACEQSFTYQFYRDKDYDVKTTLKTVGAFGTLYPFKATYHTVGIHDKDQFKPLDYFYETNSRFRHRTKEIVYDNGIPQYRISTKDKKTRRDNIEINPAYDSAIDLLSVFALLTHKVLQNNTCDLHQYSFNGKRYSLSTVKNLGKEKIKTPYFEGKALKCQYNLEILEDADAGFLLDKNKPIYFWILHDKQTGAPFIAKILVESTPFGKLESLTTKIEVKK